jgi:lipid-binding SYLF domain-containing protein
MLAVCALVACSLSASVAGEIDPDETVRAADAALRKIMEDPKYPIPQAVLLEAQGLLIIPQSTQRRFLVGSRSDRGILLMRDDVGQWTAPKFISAKGGSFGCQVGETKSDLIEIYMTRKRVDEFLKQGTFKIQAGAGVSSNISPIRRWRAAQNARAKTEVKYYSSISGLSGGIMLTVDRMKLDSETEAAYYKTAVASPTPASAAILLDNLATYSRPGPVNSANPPALPTRTTKRPLVTEVRR